MELADTTVWSKRRLLPPDGHGAFEVQLQRGDVATCDPVKAELLYTARNVDELRAMRADLQSLPFCPIGSEGWARAFDVYELLAARGGAHHREVPFNDLLIAAAAEAAGMPVLHYDRHFERIAEVTGQPVRAIAPLGSL